MVSWVLALGFAHLRRWLGDRVAGQGLWRSSFLLVGLVWSFEREREWLFTLESGFSLCLVGLEQWNSLHVVLFYACKGTSIFLLH